MDEEPWNCTLCGRELTKETDLGGDCIYCMAWFVLDPDAVLTLRNNALESIGWALFNLSKGKGAAAEVLMRNAYYALKGESWDGQD